MCDYGSIWLFWVMYRDYVHDACLICVYRVFLRFFEMWVVLQICGTKSTGSLPYES